MTVRCDTAAEGVALVTLDRPDRANGVVPELAGDLVEVLDRLEADLAAFVKHREPAFDVPTARREEGP